MLCALLIIAVIRVDLYKREFVHRLLIESELTTQATFTEISEGFMNFARMSEQ